MTERAPILLLLLMLISGCGTTNWGEELASADATRRFEVLIDLADGVRHGEVASEQARTLALPHRNDASANVRSAVIAVYEVAADTPEHAMELAGLIEDGDEFVRMEAIKLMAAQGAREASEGIARRLIDDESLHVRRTAAWALGELHRGRELGLDAVTRALSVGLTDDEAGVRYTALDALRLVTGLVIDPDPELWEQALSGRPAPAADTPPISDSAPPADGSGTDP